MATHSWNRYNIATGGANWLSDGSYTSALEGKFKSFAWNGSAWVGTGETWAYGEYTPVGSVGYENRTTELRRYTRGDSRDAHQTGTCTRHVARNTEPPGQIRGSAAGSVTSTSRSAYPDNGISGSYWYVYAGEVDTAPTTPGAFTRPALGDTLKGGGTYYIEWGASSDAEGDTISYDLEVSLNSGSFLSVGNLSTGRNRSYTIPVGTTSIQFRVKAHANGQISGARTSSIYTVSNNAAPTLTLNTPDNQVLSESAGQNELLVEGSTVDTNANDTVTVKMQINDGTIRNIASAISNGSTAIPFDRLLTYRDKVIYDGETPISNALSEGVDHKLKVWSEDGNGGISVIAERKFRVIHNRPPVISDTDRDLGTLIETPSIVYQVNDLEANAITISEKINGQVIRSFEAEPNTDYTLEIPLEMWILLQLETHTLTIEATDSAGLKSVRTYTFTRKEDTILLELKNPFETDIASTRILVTPEVYIPIGATILIEACNNAFDEVPMWEDITSMAMAKRGYSFTNTTKKAEKWGINIRFTLEKGTATQEVRLDGFGGAFE